jgi:flagellar basal body-associated protein FliL
MQQPISSTQPQPTFQPTTPTQQPKKDSKLLIWIVVAIAIAAVAGFGMLFLSVLGVFNVVAGPPFTPTCSPALLYTCTTPSLHSGILSTTFTKSSKYGLDNTTLYNVILYIIPSGTFNISNATQYPHSIIYDSITPGVPVNVTLEGGTGKYAFPKHGLYSGDIWMVVMPSGANNYTQNYTYVENVGVQAT